MEWFRAAAATCRMTPCYYMFHVLEQ